VALRCIVIAAILPDERKSVLTPVLVRVQFGRVRRHGGNHAEAYQRVSAAHSLHLLEDLWPRRNGDGVGHSARASGVEREIDILIEHKLAGHEIKIGVECRGHARDQSIEWIDSVIGKTAGLALNKVVAVSATPFSDAARRKAASHGVDLLTLGEARAVDWAARIQLEHADVLTHKFFVTFVGAFSPDGIMITDTTIDENGVVTHRDKLSEELFPTLFRLYFARWSVEAGKRIDREILKNWKRFFTENKKRYCEFTFQNLTLEIHTDNGLITITKLVYGIGILFDVERAAVRSQVLGDYLLSTMEPKGYQIRIITHRDGEMLSLDGHPVDPMK
jgi:hypothetical protein